MKRFLFALLFVFLTPVLSHGNDTSGPESVRAGVMYLIGHKSEIEMSRGHFGLFTRKDDGQVNIAFYETLQGEKTFTDALTIEDQGSRRIKHDLFAYNRREFDQEMIQEEYPQWFSEQELQCQNAFFPYTVCLISSQ